MANKRSYRPSRTSVGFRPIGQSLQRSEERLKEQARTNIDTIRLAKEQHKEATNIEISGLADAGRFQQKVLQEKQVLENAVRNRQYEALSIKADRDVDRLEGEAKELKKWADYYADILPKRAIAAGQLATGIHNYQDHLRSQAKIEKLRANGGLIEFNNETFKEKNKQLAELLNLISEENPDFSDEQKKALWGKSFGSKLNGLGAFSLDYFNKNKDAIWKQVQTYAGDSGIKINEYNIDEVVRHAGYLYLQRVDVKPESTYGQRILDGFTALGNLKYIGVKNSADALATQQYLQKSNATIVNLKGTVDPSDPNTQKALQTEVWAGITYSNKLGVFEERGRFSFGQDGTIADAIENQGEQLVTDNNTSFNGADDVRNFYNQICIPGSKKSLADGCVTIGKKHPNIVERIVETYEAKATKLTDQLDSDRVANGLTLQGEYNTALNQRQDDIKNGNTVMPQSEFDRSWVEKINNANIPSNVKKVLFTKNSLLSEPETKHVDKWLFIDGVLGDESLPYFDRLQIATKRFNSLSDTEKKALASSWDHLQIVTEYTHGDKNGYEAVASKVSTFAKSLETDLGTGNLFTGVGQNESGKNASVEMVERVIERANIIYAAQPDDKKNKNQAINEAWADVKKEVEDGKDDESSMWHRTPGEAKQGLNWTKFTNSTDESDSEEIKQRKDFIAATPGDTFEKSVAGILKEFGRKDIGPFTDAQVRDFLQYIDYIPGINSEEDIIKHPRFVSPKDALENVKLRSTVSPSLLAAQKRVTEYANTRRITESEVWDIIYKQNGIERVHKTNLTDLAKILNNGKELRLGTDPRTLYGLNLYNTIKSKRSIIPSPLIKAIADSDPNDPWTVETIENVFKEMTGVSYVKKNGGGYQITNVKKFVDNGGVHMLTRLGMDLDLLKEFGFVRHDATGIGGNPGVKDTETWNTDQHVDANRVWSESGEQVRGTPLSNEEFRRNIRLQNFADRSVYKGGLD